MSADALHLASATSAASASAAATPSAATSLGVPTPAPPGDHLTPVRGGASTLVVPAITGVDLVSPGPGEGLVRHLDAVLARLTELTGATDAASRPTSRPAAPAPHGAALEPDAEQLVRLFDAQAGSRWLEVAAHRLRAAGATSAVPGPVGREIGAAVALVARRNDPALLPLGWRAFQLARGALDHRTNRLSSGVGRALLDVARGLVGSVREPMNGSRHTIGGTARLAVVPHASTTAGHLPRAVGIAWALGRQERLPDHLRTELTWPDDGLAVAGLDAATADHGSAVGALNAACRMAWSGVPLPLLIICADDGTGAAGRVPAGWIAARFAHTPGLDYRYDDGGDPGASLRLAADAARFAREERTPVLLHVRCARLDRDPGRRDLDGDPVAATMKALVAAGVLGPDEVAHRWTSIRDEVAACVEEALREPLLGDDGADDVMAPLAPRRPEAVAARATTPASVADRARVFGTRLPESEGGLTVAEATNRALLDAGAATPGLLVLGDDVARSGGAHGVTAGLQRRLGASRVVDTPPDERTILGMALGAGACGLLPVAEIASAAALHTAEDQLRGEAASLAFCSGGAYRNPLLVRVPGLAHRPEHAGAVGIDHAVGALRDVPGLVVACPAHPSDAPALVRSCLAAAAVDGTVSVLLEPVDLYAERDMLTPGDGAWLAPYHPPELWELAHVPVGRAATWGDGRDVTVVTYGHGLRLSLRVAARLARSSIGVRVVDLRWLAPLPVDDVLREASVTGRCLVVDEARRSGGVAEALVTALLESGYTGRLARINADDSWVPPGPAAGLLLVSEDDVEDAVRTLLD